MNETTKESKFLDAINKYAESQKAKITQEIEEYKSAKIEQATEQGLKDAYELIRGEASKRKVTIANEVARRELELKRGLYAERKSVFENVFSAAREKLSDFAKSDAYNSFIMRSTQKAQGLFTDEECVVYRASFDKNIEKLISDIIPTAVFVDDSRITLGGIRIYCKAKGIILDDTLDRRLADQEQWFIENSGLEVV